MSDAAPRATRTLSIPVEDGQRHYCVPPEATRVLSVTWVARNGGRYSFAPAGWVGQRGTERHFAPELGGFVISHTPTAGSVLLGTVLEVEIELAEAAPPPAPADPPKPEPAPAPPRLRQTDLFS